MNATRSIFTQPKSFLSSRDIRMKRSERNTDESAVFAVTSTDRIEQHLEDGPMEFEDGGDFNGWYLTPVDDEKQRDERVETFKVGSASITKVYYFLFCNSE